jgi:hypothetical protein
MTGVMRTPALRSDLLTEDFIAAVVKEVQNRR